MKTVLYYISGHGFGHAVRSAMIIRKLYAKGVRTEIVSSAPKYIFECNLKGIEFGYRNCLVDIGVVQENSLTNDLEKTFEQWSLLLGDEKRWMDEHLNIVSMLKPFAVVSDIVPFAVRLAKLASLPSILVATFTWDWILDFYKDDDLRFAELSKTVGEYYRSADLVINTPFTYGIGDFAKKELVPLIGKRSSRETGEIREELKIDDRPAVMFSFGGFGFGDMKNLRLEKLKDFQFLFLAEKARRSGNLLTFSNKQVDHADLVKASDIVFSKPGYGIACETIFNRRPLLYTSRGKFAEYAPLAEDLSGYIPTRYISHKELFSGSGLEKCLRADMKFRKGMKTDAGDGDIKAAELILSI